MSWEDVEDAMHQAVVKASRLAADRVTWSYQNVNQPDLDHVVIRFGGSIPIGIDRVDLSYSASRPAGQEFRQQVRGVREVPFDLECFTEDTSGSHAARRLAELIRDRMRLPDVRYPLRNAGLSPFDPGQVSYVPDIPTANFRGRATCTIRCYVPVSDCEEYVGYIARVIGIVRPSGFAASAYSASGIAFDTGSIL